MYQEHDVVVLRRDVASHGLVEGDVGAIVGVYGPGDAYEVEFIAADGGTLAVATLTESDIRPRRRREILHVREIATATS